MDVGLLDGAEGVPTPSWSAVSHRVQEVAMGRHTHNGDVDNLEVVPQNVHRLIAGDLWPPLDAECMDRADEIHEPFPLTGSPIPAIPGPESPVGDLVRALEGVVEEPPRYLILQPVCIPGRQQVISKDAGGLDLPRSHRQMGRARVIARKDPTDIVRGQARGLC